MRARWQWLHSDLMRSANRHRFPIEFSRFRKQHVVLCGVPDPASLFEVLHGPGGDPAHRNAILQALVDLAQGEPGSRQVATILLLLALWPGLDAVHHRLCRDFPSEWSDIGVEITGRVTLGIARLDLKVVNRIAATLVMNTERDIRREVVRRHNRRKVEVAIDDESSRPLAASVESDELQLAATEWRQRLLPLVGRDTDLFLRIIMLGETQAEAGKALGLSHSAARKRHQRALQKLDALQKTSSALSHLVSSGGI